MKTAIYFFALLGVFSSIGLLAFGAGYFAYESEFRPPQCHETRSTKCVDGKVVKK